MLALIKKELEGYFKTPFGYVFMGICLLLSGLSFITYNLIGGASDMAGMFSLLGNLSFMIFPILTMRMFSEERRAGTEQLLLTSKLKIYKIVLGKYVAAVLVLVLSLAVTWVYVLIISRYSTVRLPAIVASYTGYFILAAAMIAVCTFASSLADSQVTAAVASFGGLFILVMLSSASRSIQVPVITKVIGALAITLNYDEFTRGIFTSGTVAYYISYTFIFLYLTVKNLEYRRLA